MPRPALEHRWRATVLDETPPAGKEPQKHNTAPLHLPARAPCPGPGTDRSPIPRHTRLGWKRFCGDWSWRHVHDSRDDTERTADPRRLGRPRRMEPGSERRRPLLELDRDGFLALEIDGRLAGGGAIIRYDEWFGFMGLFLIDLAHRGRKLGTELWYARRNRLLARMNPGATIGLDAVDAMIPFYERGGFQAHYRHRRFEVLAAGERTPPPTPTSWT